MRLTTRGLPRASVGFLASCPVDTLTLPHLPGGPGPRLEQIASLRWWHEFRRRFRRGCPRRPHLGRRETGPDPDALVIPGIIDIFVGAVSSTAAQPLSSRNQPSYLATSVAVLGHEEKAGETGHPPVPLGSSRRVVSGRIQAAWYRPPFAVIRDSAVTS